MGKILLFRKKRLTALACALAAALIFYVVNYPYAATAAATNRQLPIYCVQRDQKMVAISFDAAWGNEDTQELIDIMDRYDITATFFVVGSWVDKYPESVKALSDAGHEVMNHSNSHAHMSQLSTQEIVADLNACNDKIEAVTGVRPTLVPAEVGIPLLFGHNGGRIAQVIGLVKRARGELYEVHTLFVLRRNHCVDI